MPDFEKASRDNLGVYSGFLTVTKWAILLVALVLILMAIFLV